MTITLVVLAVAALMMLIELRWPGRQWPKVRSWWPRAIAFNAIQIGMVFSAGMVWDGWMQRHRLWSAEPLGTIGGAAVGYVVITFIYYWWHRARHENAFLWRWVHQLHHSPQRIEIMTSFYKHPVELFLNGVLSSAILYLLVGLDQKSAALAVTFTGLAELFYHWNVTTPYWLGFIVQRPESHCVHHEEGVHSFNFGDLPLWDMLFGTFRNPHRWEARCGFGETAEMRVRDMLLGRDVNAGA